MRGDLVKEAWWKNSNATKDLKSHQTLQFIEK